MIKVSAYRSNARRIALVKAAAGLVQYSYGGANYSFTPDGRGGYSGYTRQIDHNSPGWRDYMRRRDENNRRMQDAHDMMDSDDPDERAEGTRLRNELVRSDLAATRAEGDRAWSSYQASMASVPAPNASPAPSTGTYGGQGSARPPISQPPVQQPLQPAGSRYRAGQSGTRRGRSYDF